SRWSPKSRRTSGGSQRSFQQILVTCPKRTWQGWLAQESVATSRRVVLRTPLLHPIDEILPDLELSLCAGGWIRVAGEVVTAFASKSSSPSSGRSKKPAASAVSFYAACPWSLTSGR